MIDYYYFFFQASRGTTLILLVFLLLLLHLHWSLVSTYVMRQIYKQKVFLDTLCKYQWQHPTNSQVTE